MNIFSQIKWWAYLHSNGTVQLKRYFDDSYKQDCGESPFCTLYTQPFPAENREQALTIAEEKLL